MEQSVNRRVLIVAHPYEIGRERLSAEGFERTTAPGLRPALFVRQRPADAACDVIAIIGIGHEAVAPLAQLKEQGLLDNAHVLLTGSAGSYTLPVLHTVQCSTPFTEWEDSGYERATIVCVHEFVSPEAPHPELHVDGVCFDMESEALLAVCRDANVHSVSIVKVISDDGSGSLGDWATVCQQQVQPLVWEVAKRFFSKNMLHDI